MIRKTILAAMLAASLGAVALPASAEIVVRVAPPPPRVEVVPAPRHGRTWVAGHWGWRNNHHQWIAGTWVRDRPGYHYSQAQWVERDGRWHMQQGNWRRGDRDGDGIPNRRDSDRDGDGVRNSQDQRPDNPRRY